MATIASTSDGATARLTKPGEEPVMLEGPSEDALRRQVLGATREYVQWLGRPARLRVTDSQATWPLLVDTDGTPREDGDPDPTQTTATLDTPTGVGLRVVNPDDELEADRPAAAIATAEAPAVAAVMASSKRVSAAPVAPRAWSASSRPVQTPARPRRASAGSAGQRLPGRIVALGALAAVVVVGVLLTATLRHGHHQTASPAASHPAVAHHQSVKTAGAVSRHRTGPARHVSPAVHRVGSATKPARHHRRARGSAHRGRGHSTRRHTVHRSASARAHHARPARAHRVAPVTHSSSTSSTPPASVPTTATPVTPTSTPAAPAPAPSPTPVPTRSSGGSGGHGGTPTSPGGVPPL